MSAEQEFADLCDAIWYLMECRCQQCTAELETLEWERLKQRDMMAWSKLVAERALEHGWGPVTESIGVVCPNCRKQTQIKPD